MIVCECYCGNIKQMFFGSVEEMHAYEKIQTKKSIVNLGQT